MRGVVVADAARCPLCHLTADGRDEEGQLVFGCCLSAWHEDHHPTQEQRVERERGLKEIFSYWSEDHAAALDHYHQRTLLLEAEVRRLEDEVRSLRDDVAYVEAPPENIIHGVWQSKEEYDAKEARLTDVLTLQEEVAELHKKLNSLEKLAYDQYEVEDTSRICELCGHDMSATPGNVSKCGYAAVANLGETIYLCHADDHSCYQRWTVFGERSGADSGEGRP